MSVGSCADALQSTFLDNSCERVNVLMDCVCVVACPVTTFCCVSISRRHTFCARRANAVTPSSQTLSVPTSITGHIGHRSTARASAANRPARCDRSTSASISAAVTMLWRPEMLAVRGEAASEVCCVCVEILENL